MIADALYVGDTTVDRVMLGDVEVWSAAPVVPDLPVVTITGTTMTGARDQFRAACIDYGTTFDTVKVLPFRLDTSNTTSMAHMFRDCAALTSVPPLDTSNVTSMSNMFVDCAALTTAPEMDTSNVDRMNNMFQRCTHLTHVPDLATSNVTNAGWMFDGCTLLTDGNVRLIGKHPTVITSAMIQGSGLTREPFYDTDGNPI